MKKSAETALQREDDEEGVAEGAARLGPDGGPATGAGKQTVAYGNGDDDFADEAWLEEELSDEELAALGEEDFDFDEFSDEDLAASEFADDAEMAPGASLGAAAFDDAVEVAAEAASYDVLDEIADEASEETLPGAEQDYAIPQDLREEAEERPETGSDDGAFEQGPQQSANALVAARGVMMQSAGTEFDGAEFEEGGEDHRPVPRISIHAFCETPSTTMLLEKASVDRRLSKAHLTIHMGGIAKAVDHFQTSATPNLVILETLASGSEIFAKLGQLAEVCDPSTKVVIIGQVNDIILYRELIRQGISEYIVQPHSPLQIIKTIAELYVDPSAPPIGRTIAFVGARGGVGSSSLAHNVGWCAAEDYESDTIILDLDLPFGTASLDFDQDASAGLLEALTSPERLDDVLLDRLLQKQTDRLSLFTAPGALDRDYEVDDQAFETVLDVVRGSAPTIIVDVPHNWCSWSKRILTTADEIVITATPDLAAFRNTKQLVDILSASRPNDAPPKLVINQFDPKTSAVQPAQFIEHVGVKPAQVFTWEPQLFIAAATNAAPIVEISPRSKTTQAIRELSAQLIGRSEASLAKSKFRISDLFKKKR